METFLRVAHESDSVLIADDDVMIRRMVAKVLERDGFEVDEAKDGAEAIEKCLAGSFRVILLDLMMPRMDGGKVLEWMCRNRPELIARVVVMTASIGATTEHAKSLCTVIHKPFDVEHLVQCVRQHARVSARRPDVTPVSTEDTPDPSRRSPSSSRPDGDSRST